MKNKLRRITKLNALRIQHNEDIIYTGEKFPCHFAAYEIFQMRRMLESSVFCQFTLREMPNSTGLYCL